MSNFDPEEWLEVADTCCRSAPRRAEEAFLRTALNRAYYTVLLTIKQRIERALGPGSVLRTGTHSALLQAVRSGGPAFDRIHDGLEWLKRSREKADYELTAPAPQRGFVYSRIRLSRRLIQRNITSLPDAAFRTLSLPRK